MTQRRVYWDLIAYDIIDSTGPHSAKPDNATYHSTLTKDRSERYTYWAADLDIGDVRDIMVERRAYLDLCGSGAPYYLMFKDYDN